MNSSWHISVLIPARNEEDLLPRCLRSVLASRALLPAEITCDVIVVVDSSSDRTGQIANSMLRQSGCGRVISTQAGMVGRVRALAANTALMHRITALDTFWLAHTDADCQVPANWLTEQLSLACQGAEAVAGIVDVDCFDEHEKHVERRFRATYLIKPDGSHPHVHGANLGVRADAYLRSGGWSDLATAEDHDLWRRLTNIGCRKVSTASIRVLTSGRRTGRAPFGFADALAAHNESCA